MIYKLLVLSSLFAILSCSDKGTNPPISGKDSICVITDSTSHFISWNIDTIGTFPTTLYDIVAIDDRNVWAVGEIELKEYPESDRYNAVKWNGDEYEYFKVHTSEGAPRLDVVLGFNINDIWFFGVGGYHHWNGDSISANELKLGDVNGLPKAAWGVSSSDYYIVGDNGSISHYDGNSFTLMESGTELDLFDIQGYVDSDTGEKHIWVLGSRDQDAVVLEYADGQWINIWDMDLFNNSFKFPHALYIPNNKSLLMSIWGGASMGGRLYCFNQTDITDHKLLGEYATYDFDLAAFGLNDLFIVGTFNGIEHFNGVQFKDYPEISGSGNNYSVSVVNKSVFIAGTVNQLGLFIHGQK